MFRIAPLAAIIGLTAAFTAPAQADTVTSSFEVRITIQKACDVTTTAPTDLDFGAHSSLATAISGTSTISVTCTPGSAYTIGLDAGLHPGTAGDIATRRMSDGASHYVAYQLYQDPGHTTPWGQTIGTDTLAAVGTGAAQITSVHGLVASANAQAGSYADTIGVTVTY
ncbi:MAG TPA: spore coat U domain-containing protein [Dokdonella sp.]|uniref:Csu type fimbrial protein n=1 Tax=Dokdonella sp. TaxID=2291710 RepID=UPI002CD03B1D|nr:spore coat U domain-containing protein [Dokdonella sp.]HUD42839.1 spore coat U domain-containing protein [Dokdonella sp.]